MIKKALAGLMAVFIGLSFILLYRGPLQADDASAYALAAKNMIILGQWLAPLVTPGDITSFFDKPPLGIWMLAAIPKIVGLNELTIHIPNVVYYCVLLFMITAVPTLKWENEGNSC